MDVSVVVNTYNRAANLRTLLRSLGQQTHDAFEVIVVNGPSTDETAAVLDEFGRSVGVAVCPEVNLAMSRNVGIAAAAGEVVAFIDDDSVADPRWLSELTEAYDSPRVGGVGGLVYDHTAYTLQRESFCVADRSGHAWHDAELPRWAY